MIRKKLKKGLLSTIGIVLITKDKVLQFRERLMTDARLNRKEADRLIDDLCRSGSDQWSESEKWLKKRIRDVLNNMDVGSLEATEELQKKVDNLQTRLAILESKFEGREII